MASNFTDNRRRWKACAAWPLTWGLGQIRGCARWLGAGVANQQASTPRTGDCYRFRARKVPVGAPLKLHRIVIRTYNDDRWRSNRANVNDLPYHSPPSQVSSRSRLPMPGILQKTRPAPALRRLAPCMLVSLIIPSTRVNRGRPHRR